MLEELQGPDYENWQLHRSLSQHPVAHLSSYVLVLPEFTHSNQSAAPVVCVTAALEP